MAQPREWRCYMAYTPLVTVMATLVTITTFLEGFGRARLQRSIDQVGEHGQALLTELTNASAPFARSEAYKEALKRDFDRPFKLPGSAAVIRYGVWVAVPISTALFALLVTGLAGSGSSFESNPVDWHPLFTAALVLLIAQIALAVLAFTDSRGNEKELARARAVFVARLVNEAEKILHDDKPPNVESARLWADAVAGTRAHLPQRGRVNDLARGILQSIEARFHLSAALWLEWEIESSPDTAGVAPKGTADQLRQEIDQARELLAALPQDASTVNSQLAYAVVLVIDFSSDAADTPAAASVLWDAVEAYDVARPPRWLLVHKHLPWEEVIKQYSGKDADVPKGLKLGADVLKGLKLSALADLLLYADARDLELRREHCLLAAEALRAGGWSSDIEHALRAMFEACETTGETSNAYFGLTRDRAFDSAAVLLSLIQVAANQDGSAANQDGTAANQDGTWQKEAAADIVALEAGEGKLRADPVGWMPVIRELRRLKRSKAETTVLTRAFPGKSETEAVLAWLDLLDESGPDKAEREAMNLYLAWQPDDADRTTVSQQTVDAVVGLLARSPDEIYRFFGERLQEAAATWTQTGTDDR